MNTKTHQHRSTRFRSAHLNIILPLIVLFPLLALSGCRRGATRQTVVMYCSVDEVFALPVIAALERQTNLNIVPLFDVEAAKTAGLANRIRAEAARPRADVFWASTVLQTEMLAHENLLARYQPPSAADIPVAYRDPKGFWTGVGLRARVLVSSSPRPPQSLAYVPGSRASGFAISNPQFGTGSDFSACYAERWGNARALQYFHELQAAGTRVLPGNADVALAVADGNLQIGLIDTDDYLFQVREKKPIFLVRTDADNVVIPGTAAMIAGAPHLEAARQLLNALCSDSIEKLFTSTTPGVFSLRQLNQASGWRSGGVDFGFLRGAPHDSFASWRPAWEKIRTPLADTLTP